MFFESKAGSSGFLVDVVAFTAASIIAITCTGSMVFTGKKTLPAELAVSVGDGIGARRLEREQTRSCGVRRDLSSSEDAQVCLS